MCIRDRLYGEAGDHTIICRLPERKEIYQWQTGYVAFDSEAIHLFDAETEENLLKAN